MPGGSPWFSALYYELETVCLYSNDSIIQQKWLHIKNHAMINLFLRQKKQTLLTNFYLKCDLLLQRSHHEFNWTVPENTRIKYHYFKQFSAHTCWYLPFYVSFNLKTNYFNPKKVLYWTALLIKFLRWVTFQTNSWWSH